MRQINHYGLTQDEQRRRSGSNGDFTEPAPLCGNGSWHASTTRIEGQVNCARCLELLDQPRILAILGKLG